MDTQSPATVADTPSRCPAGRAVPRLELPACDVFGVGGEGVGGTPGRLRILPLAGSRAAGGRDLLGLLAAVPRRGGRGHRPLPSGKTGAPRLCGAVLTDPEAFLIRTVSHRPAARRPDRAPVGGRHPAVSRVVAAGTCEAKGPSVWHDDRLASRLRGSRGDSGGLPHRGDEVVRRPAAHAGPGRTERVGDRRAGRLAVTLVTIVVASRV
jgi:hypothetical protein